MRPEQIKKVARELINRYPDKFSTDFEQNKKSLETVARISTVKMRNRIAGYITRLLAITQASQSSTEKGEVEAEETK
ncbi:MAG: 30S ribosomal protein S17e [Candidatus Bathyarchaeia archaeon]